MKDSTVIKYARIINYLGLTAIIIVLLSAFAFQFVLYELPCPLCLLQRVGFTFIAFGFLLNLRYGSKPCHYTVILLSAIYTCFVALRQVSLHIVPNTGSYGTAVFGIHLYTWSFVAAVMVIIGVSILLGADRQYEHPPVERKPSGLTDAFFALVCFIIFINLVSVILECGFKEQCPDNPIKYELLK